MPRTTPLAFLLMGIFASPVLASPDADGYEWAVITHPGNRDTIPEETPFEPDLPIGGVDYVFRIATTEVTVGQWFEFALGYVQVYDQSDFEPYFPGRHIQSSGTSVWIPDLSKVNHFAELSWQYAARYCNWLHNGKVNERWAFETGAYDTTTFTFDPDGTPNHQFRRSPGARYWIPSLDEWTKAAYFDPNRYGPGQEGYWMYPNGSDERPIGGLLASEGGERNAGSSSQGWPLAVASFPLIKSPFGLLDAAGGAAEWLEEQAVRFGGQPDVMVFGGSPFIDPFNDEPENADRIDYHFGFSVDVSLHWSGFRLAAALPCPADFAAPFGVLNAADLAAYIDLYQSGDAAADLAEPFGVLNFFDLAAYLAGFTAGCPEQAR